MASVLFDDVAGLPLDPVGWLLSGGFLTNGSIAIVGGGFDRERDADFSIFDVVIAVSTASLKLAPEEYDVAVCMDRPWIDEHRESLGNVIYACPERLFEVCKPREGWMTKAMSLANFAAAAAPGVSWSSVYPALLLVGEVGGRGLCSVRFFGFDMPNPMTRRVVDGWIDAAPEDISVVRSW